MEETHDDKTFTLTGRHWTGTYPLEDLPKWLEFYRLAQVKFPKSANQFSEAIVALERLSKKVSA